MKVRRIIKNNCQKNKPSKIAVITTLESLSYTAENLMKFFDNFKHFAKKFLKFLSHNSINATSTAPAVGVPVIVGNLKSIAVANGGNFM